jgi:hypothetical protein
MVSVACFRFRRDVGGMVVDELLLRWSWHLSGGMDFPTTVLDNMSTMATQEQRNLKRYLDGRMDCFYCYI